MIYRPSDIDKIISNTVVDYLNEGYNVVLTNPSLQYSYVTSYVQLIKHIDNLNYNIVRIYLKQKYNYNVGTKEYTILVNKFNFEGEYRADKYIKSPVDDNDNDIVCVSKQSFYEILYNKDIYVDADLYDEIRKKVLRRHENSVAALKKESEILYKTIDLKKLPNDFIDSIMKRVNRRQGFSKALSTCIKSVELVYSGGIIRNTSDNTAYELRVNIATKSKTDMIVLRSYKSISRKNYQVSKVNN